MMVRLPAALLAALLLAGGEAQAQQEPQEYNFYGFYAATNAKDIQLPTQLRDIKRADTVMALYKPDGDGPFPALVLLHQCGGLAGPNPNKAIVEWAKVGVARGYAVLVIDAFTQRGVDVICNGPRNGLVFGRGTADAMQAAAFMRAQPFVDPKRVALAGFSWGAGAAIMAASKQSLERISQSGGGQLGKAEPFDAVASFYPPCINRPANGSTPYHLVSQRIETPLLVMMGGRDTETPPADCTALLDSRKQAGAPIEWHIYPTATHCFDCPHTDGKKLKDARGNYNEYRYDKAVTQDAANRMFAFFDAAFKK